VGNTARGEELRSYWPGNPSEEKTNKTWRKISILRGRQRRNRKGKNNKEKRKNSGYGFMPTRLKRRGGGGTLLKGKGAVGAKEKD